MQAVLIGCGRLDRVRAHHAAEVVHLRAHIGDVVRACVKQRAELRRAPAKEFPGKVCPLRLVGHILQTCNRGIKKLLLRHASDLLLRYAELRKGVRAAFGSCCQRFHRWLERLNRRAAVLQDKIPLLISIGRHAHLLRHFIDCIAILRRAGNHFLRRVADRARGGLDCRRCQVGQRAL